MDTSRLTIENFEASHIDGSSFDHRSHIYVAWLYLDAFDTEVAIQRFDAALRRLVVALGAESKYNAMVTWLFLKLIAARKRDDEDWESFASHNEDLFAQFPR